MMEIPAWLTSLLNHIEAHLTSDISLEKLASDTGYSVRHLQRQFKTLTKDNLGDYIRGRRLTMAMSEIMSGNRPLLDIALDYGFQSQESFTRAFQARFIFPPRRFRLKKIDNPITLQEKIDENYLHFVNSGTLQLEPTIETLKPMTFAGIGAEVGLNSFQSPAWSQTIFNAFARLRETAFLNEANSPASFLISYHEADTDGIHMLAAKRFNDEATNRKLSLPEGVEHFLAPGGHYAVFNFKGVMSQFTQRGNYILGSWLPRSSYWLGNAPAIVELLLDHSSGIVTAKMCIPLRRRRISTVDSWWD